MSPALLCGGVVETLGVELDTGGVVETSVACPHTGVIADVTQKNVKSRLNGVFLKQQIGSSATRGCQYKTCAVPETNPGTVPAKIRVWNHSAGMIDHIPALRDLCESALGSLARETCLPCDEGQTTHFRSPSSHGVRRLPSSRKLGGLGGLQQRGHALLVTGSGVAMDNALLGGAIDFRLELGKELDRFIRLAGLRQGADFLFGSADRGDLSTIAGTTTDRTTGLLCGRTSICHSPPNCPKRAPMSTRLCGRSCPNLISDTRSSLLSAKQSGTRKGKAGRILRRKRTARPQSEGATANKIQSAS